MTLTKEFMEAVGLGDKTLVRIMLKDIMLVDPSMKTFEEMLQYAEKRMPDLYDEHDEEELKQNPAEWDEAYMNMQMVIVVSNFSKERVALLKKIVRKLFGHKVQKQTDEKCIVDAVSRSNSELSGVQIAGGIVGVAGAGTLIGGIVGSSIPIAVIGGVTLAGGIAMIAFGRKTEK